MSNWTGAARSNYVRFTDIEGLRQALRPFDISIEDGWEGMEGMHALFSQDSDTGAWPITTYVEDEDGEREVEFDPVALICPFMAPDQVLVMVEAGHEKLRYITGHAIAYNAKGESVGLSLLEIYGRAEEAFGLKTTAAEY
jgi:hypothetical protein